MNSEPGLRHDHALQLHVFTHVGGWPCGVDLLRRDNWRALGMNETPFPVLTNQPVGIKFDSKSPTRYGGTGARSLLPKLRPHLVSRNRLCGNLPITKELWILAPSVQGERREPCLSDHAGRLMGQGMVSKERATTSEYVQLDNSSSVTGETDSTSSLQSLA